MANFSSGGLAFLILTVIFIMVCGVFISLRFVAMRISRRSFYIDDAFVLFAYANVVALGSVGIWSCVNGLGKSAAVLTPYEIAAAAKLLFTAYVCWLLASVFYKLAILALYNRIFATRTFRRWSYALSALTACYCISFFCVYMTNCVPIDHMWHPTPGGWCRDGQVSDYSTLGINMLLDLSILILPLPTLWSLQLPTRKKITVTIMLSFGLLTIAVMIWRVIWTQEYRANPDFTTYLSKIGIVSGFELWFGVIVACIPTLAPLVRTERYAQGNSGKASSGLSSSAKRRHVDLESYPSSKFHRDDYKRTSESQDPFFHPSRPGQDEYAPAGHEERVIAESKFDPAANRQASPMTPDTIYVHTNIQI